MGDVLKFSKPPVERYQFFQFHGYADTYRIVWINKKPVRAEVLSTKDQTWVQLQRYKEVELIKTAADWETFGK